MPEWFTVAEAAAYLKLSKNRIHQLVRQGKLPAYNIAGSGDRRFKREDLDALLTPAPPKEQGQP